MNEESTKDKLVRLDAVVDTLQSDLESLAKNTKINFIETENVKQTSMEFVNKFSDKLNMAIEDVAILADVLKGILKRKWDC